MTTEISGKIIVSPIIRKLKQKFPDLPVYKERVNQGIKRPCFFIWQIKMNQKKQLRERYQRKYNIAIVYHPDSDVTTSYDKFPNLEHDLAELLKSIEVGTTYTSEKEVDVPGILVRATDINSKPENNDLHFFASYTLNMTDEKIEELMQTLSTNITTH